MVKTYRMQYRNIVLTFLVDQNIRTEVETTLVAYIYTLNDFITKIFSRCVVCIIFQTNKISGYKDEKNEVFELDRQCQKFHLRKLRNFLKIFFSKVFRQIKPFCG